MGLKGSYQTAAKGAFLQCLKEKAPRWTAWERAYAPPSKCAERGSGHPDVGDHFNGVSALGPQRKIFLAELSSFGADLCCQPDESIWTGSVRAP